MSHNLAVVRKLCERVLVMYLGRVVEEGPTEEVFRAPRHPYTRMLLESVPLLDPARERARLATLAVQGETPSAVDRPSGCAFPHALSGGAAHVRRRAVQSRRTSRNRTRWPACAGANIVN